MIADEEMFDLMTRIEEILDNHDSYTSAITCINSMLSVMREMEDIQERNKLADWLIGRLLIEFSTLKQN